MRAMTKSWNKADRVLFLAFLVFLLALFAHLQLPHSVFASGFLFCAEAALVGGIADWFAVTALFRKPLGFPYHTAILPRRRQSFIKASVTMVQKEFFSRRKVFRHLERLHLMPMLMKWLGEPDTRAKVSHHLYHYARGFLLKKDSEKRAAEFARRIRTYLSTMEPEDLFANIGHWLQQSGRDKDFLERVSAYLRVRAERPETAKAIESMLEQYEKEKAKSTLALFLTGLAEAMDLVNLEDAANIMQKQLVAMLKELGTRDSQLQQDMLELFYEKTAVLNAEPEFHQLVHELRDSLVADLPIEEVVRRAAAHMRDHLEADAVEEHLPMLRSRLADIIEAEYDRGLHLLQEDDELRHTVGRFLYDLIARSALHAQTLVGVVVESVLARLTDEQLNHLVYDKVEPDLLWIRMNGSIVGSGIGLVIFILLQLVP